MKIKLNGEIQEINGTHSLSNFMKLYMNGKEAKGIAVALNSVIVPKQKWSETVLNDNDEIEIVHAVQGG